MLKPVAPRPVETSTAGSLPIRKNASVTVPPPARERVVEGSMSPCAWLWASARADVNLRDLAEHCGPPGKPEAQVLDVPHRLAEELADVLVVKLVDDAPAGATADHEAE